MKSNERKAKQMKLKDLIRELEAIHDQYGDLLVVVPSHENGAMGPVTVLDVDAVAETLHLLP